MTTVLFLNPGAEIGGAERSLLELIRSLPREAFRVRLVLPNDGPLERAAREAGAEVTVSLWPGPLRRLGRELSLQNRLLLLAAPFLFLLVFVRTARLARRLKADVIHTNGTKSHLAGWGAALGARAPMVWHVRDVVESGALSRLLRVAGALLPSAIVANSQASARPFAGGWLGRRIAPKLHVIYNGLDPREFRPVPADRGLAQALGLPQGALVIGALGALAPLKGHIHLVRALPRLVRSLPQIRLLLVGEEMYETAGHRGYRQVLEAEAGRLGVTDRVIFAGRREDVVAIYALLDIVVLPSVRPESFGRVAAEAMSCGRPVIASRVAGPEEIIESDEVGVLIAPGDPGAIAAAIESLAADPARRERMGRLGREMVGRRFALARHSSEIRAVYDSVARSRAGTRGARAGQETIR